jgi:hypothetical protein
MRQRRTAVSSTAAPQAIGRRLASSLRLRAGIVGLALTLTIGASAVVPVAAQAAGPHVYSNNVIVGSEPKPIIGFGTITLALTKPPVDVGTTITCHNATAGTTDNPAGGGPAVAVVDIFATFNCESEKNCTLGEETRVVAEKLPWSSKLTEEVAGTIRDETTGVQVDIECINKSNEKIEKEIKFDIGSEPTKEKGQRPVSHNGTSALHPGFLEFGSGSGELEVVGSKETITGKTEGEVKILGYEEQELISDHSS